MILFVYSVRVGRVGMRADKMDMEADLRAQGVSQEEGNEDEEEEDDDDDDDDEADDDDDDDDEDDDDEDDDEEEELVSFLFLAAIRISAAAIALCRFSSKAAMMGKKCMPKWVVAFSL